MNAVTLLCTVRDCRLPLAEEARRLVCANGHSFDRARSGYVNLLQPQDRRSKTPGDSAEAAAARRRFLERGRADPLLAAIVEALPLAPPATLLDVGCGEGHYTAAFRSAYGVDAYGVDISVPAIELAAKSHRDCHWIVANADRLLPFSDGSFSAVASITSRLAPGEFHRVLGPGGTLLLVLPGADDLIELREAILGEGVERDRVARTLQDFAPRFTLQAHRSIAHVASLDPDSMIDVMSSSYRGLRTRERAKLESLGAMKVTLSRDILIMRAA